MSGVVFGTIRSIVGFAFDGRLAAAVNGCASIYLIEHNSPCFFLEFPTMPTSSEREVPDSHYIAIGQIASRWALLETTIDISIWGLAELSDKNGACITSQIAGSARKLDAVISLVQTQQPTNAVLIKRLNRFAETTRKLTERRNRVVHDHWILNEKGDPVRLEMTARRLLRYQRVQVTMKELNELASLIISHTNDYFEFMKFSVEAARSKTSPKTHKPK
jgi:hypothetical protein